MIKRSEIEQLFQDGKTRQSVDLLWRINQTTIPELKIIGHKGDNHRFGAAKHMIHTFFTSQANQEKAPEATFSALCDKFQASAEDISIASAKVIEGVEDIKEMCLADVMTQIIWLWFLETHKEYGDYLIEFKFFLYTMAVASKDDEKMKRSGREYLLTEVVPKPSKLLGLIYNILKSRRA